MYLTTSQNNEVVFKENFKEAELSKQHEAIDAGIIDLENFKIGNTFNSIEEIDK